MNAVKNFKLGMIIWSIGYLLLGIALCIWPGASMQVIAAVFAVLTLAYGVTRVIGFFCKADMGFPYRYDLCIGILDILLGALMLRYPSALLTLLPIAAGVFILIDGLTRVQTALELKRWGYGWWWVHFLLSLLTVMLGGMLLFNPFGGAAVLMIYLGISLLCTGAGGIFTAVTLSRTVRQFKQDLGVPIDVDFHEL